MKHSRFTLTMLERVVRLNRRVELNITNDMLHMFPHLQKLTPFKITDAGLIKTKIVELNLTYSDLITERGIPPTVQSITCGSVNKIRSLRKTNIEYINARHNNYLEVLPLTTCGLNAYFNRSLTTREVAKCRWLQWLVVDSYTQLDVKKIKRRIPGVLIMQLRPEQSPSTSVTLPCEKD